MSQVFGIYFGNSSASIAISKEDGKVDILTNAEGDRVTPTVVKISAKEQVVGLAAVGGLSSRLGNTVRCNKSLLDESATDEAVESARAASSAKIERDEASGKLYYSVQDEEKTLKYTPHQVATIIFKKLFNIGSSAAPGQKELSCVLCIPRQWSEHNRKETVECATEAGWKVIQVISEAPAATLAYSLDTSLDSMNVLVYRLGGVSCDATVMEFNRGFITVLSDVRSSLVGGQKFVEVIKTHLSEEFYRKYHLNPAESRKSMLKLSLAAEGTLQVLSTLGSCSKFVESLCDGVDFSFNMSRARLEALVSPLFPPLLKPIWDALAKANLRPLDINKVVLVGSPLKMPRLVSEVKAQFSPECDVLTSLSPDEVVALGAARQAGYLNSSHPVATEHLSQTTMQIPFIDSPIILQFETGQEVRIEDVPAPYMESIDLEVNSKTVHVTAKQFVQGGACRDGQVTINVHKVPCQLKAKIEVTLQNEVVIETVDSVTSESQRWVVCLLSEE